MFSGISLIANIDQVLARRSQVKVFDMMTLGLRLGDMPRVLIATTPRTSAFMKKLVAMDDRAPRRSAASRSDGSISHSTLSPISR
jgi:phage terminase large subunit-like protein